MRATSKRQVTIPLQLRRKAGILPGTEMQFSEEKGPLYLRKVADSGRGKQLVERMAGRGNVKMSTDEILALSRGKR